jgi:hypothetical protein
MRLERYRVSRGDFLSAAAAVVFIWGGEFVGYSADVARASGEWGRQTVSPPTKRACAEFRTCQNELNSHCCLSQRDEGCQARAGQMRLRTILNIWRLPRLLKLLSTNIIVVSAASEAGTRYGLKPV